jgi:phage repressor protein C with HTH and peptisase S24 domain
MSKIDSDIAARLRQARSKRYETPVDASRAMGVNSQTYYGHENGHRGFGAKTGQRYADFFRCRFEWLMTGKGFSDLGNTSEPIDAPAISAITLEHASVPVLGAVYAGLTGDRFSMGQAVDTARRLPGIANSKTVFALYVRGDSMFPRFADGDLIYVDPGRVARIGDDVLIELAGEPGEPATALVKRLVSRSGSKIVVRQFSPDSELTFPAKQIVRISRVLTVNDLAGV